MEMGIALAHEAHEPYTHEGVQCSSERLDAAPDPSSDKESQGQEEFHVQGLHIKYWLPGYHQSPAPTC